MHEHLLQLRDLVEVAEQDLNQLFLIHMIFLELSEKFLSFLLDPFLIKVASKGNDIVFLLLAQVAHQGVWIDLLGVQFYWRLQIHLLIAIGRLDLSRPAGTLAGDCLSSSLRRWPFD